jgi:hypothetical protein
MAGFHSAQGECCDFAGPFCLRASSPWPLPRGRRLIGDPATAASVRLSSQRGSPGQGAEAPGWATRSPDDGAGTGRLSPWPGAPSASSSGKRRPTFQRAPRVGGVRNLTSLLGPWRAAAPVVLSGMPMPPVRLSLSHMPVGRWDGAFCRPTFFEAGGTAFFAEF